MGGEGQVVGRRQPPPDNNNDDDKLGSQDEKQPTSQHLPPPSHPVPSSHCQGMITTLAKTLMRGLSTYFKGSFEFPKRPRLSVTLSRSEGKFSLDIFFSCYDTELIHSILG